MSSERHGPLLGLSCREASRLISESLDRALTRRERWSLRLHTLICTACQSFARQTKMIRDALALLPAPLRETLADSAVQMSTKRRTLIKRLLAEAEQADSQD